MTNEELAAIRARSEAATPGPWKWEGENLCAPEPYYVTLKPYYDDDTGEVTTCVFDNDANFIAHARDDIPALIAEIERLTAALKEETTRRYCAECNYDHWYKQGSKLIAEVEALTARAEKAEAERDKAVDDMKTMADCMRESEETTESCCWACKYDPTNNDYLGTTECPGYERDDCFEWLAGRSRKVMGCKYTIHFTRNGLCDYRFDRQTNSPFRALWYLLTLSIKYPIVDFEIRRGYIPCENCNADWCEKSFAWKEWTEG